jgi:hypothetical protein
VTSQLEQLNIFDYAALDKKTRTAVQKRTAEIQELMKRTAQGIFDIGTKLIEVKELLGYGEFGNWLEHEFDWSEKTAQRFMAVATRFKSDKLSDLVMAPSALYLLAQASTPDSVVTSVLERAESGERVTRAEVKAAIAEAREPEEDLAIASEIEGRLAIASEIEAVELKDEGAA